MEGGAPCPWSGRLRGFSTVLTTLEKRILHTLGLSNTSQPPLARALADVLPPRPGTAPEKRQLTPGQSQVQRRVCLKSVVSTSQIVPGWSSLRPPRWWMVRIRDVARGPAAFEPPRQGREEEAKAGHCPYGGTLCTKPWNSPAEAKLRLLNLPLGASQDGRAWLLKPPSSCQPLGVKPGLVLNGQWL